MTDLDDSQLHPDVGSTVFQYWHPAGNGSWERRAFYIKHGDNPDFWLAERMLPGAAKGESIVGVFEVDAEDDDQTEFSVIVRVGQSVFRTHIFAKTSQELLAAIDIIGGMELEGTAYPITLRDRLKLFCRYYWERRPILRRRSPLDRF